jgi:hypothetical protein
LIIAATKESQAPHQVRRGGAGQKVDRAFMKSMRDVAGRIAELIDLFDRADIVLVDALKKTATREELGLE